MRLRIAVAYAFAALMLAVASQTACSPAKNSNTELTATGQTPNVVQAAAGEPAWRKFLGLKPRTVEITVPAGSPLKVRLDHAVATTENQPGDRFSGSLAEPVVVGGASVIPAGAKVEGVVTNSSPSGRLKGRAILSLTIDRVEWQGQAHQVETTSVTRASAGHKKRNWTLIGGGSGLGALIGGLAGGGKGAAIGAGAGAAAGTTGAAITGKRQVRIPAESLLSFKTRQSFNVQYTPAERERG